MIKASHAIPKRIHRDTVFLYHSGYLREGSIPGGEARSEAWESQSCIPQTEMDTEGLVRVSRVGDVPTGLRLLVSSLRVQEASLDWHLGFVWKLHFLFVCALLQWLLKWGPWTSSISTT